MSKKQIQKECGITQIYCNHYVNLQEEPYFFGSGRNTQRYDKNRDEVLANKGMEMQRKFWIPEEIKLKKDRADFQSLTKAEHHIFTKQLQKLVFLDSLQGRTPLMIFGQITTLPELEGVLIEQEYFESRIHSRSYSYMIEEMLPNPEIIFNDTWKNTVLLKHSDTVAREYQIAYKGVIDYLYKKMNNITITDDEMEKFKEDIMLALVSMNILEGIRFYLGFASIWAITEFSGKMAGSSRILALIQRDEKIHLAFTQHLINKLKRTNEWKDVWKRIQPKVYDMYFEASSEEFEWADYLFSEGSIIGMNAEIGKSYVKFLTNQRLKAIGLKPIYPEIQNNPLKWIGKYVNLHLSEGALQEQEAIDYIVNPIKDDVKDVKEIWKEVENLS